METCPICGTPIPKGLEAWDLEQRTFVSNGVAVRFGRIRFKVFDALWKTRNKGGVQSRERLALMVYGDDPDGGPLYLTALSQAMRGIRLQLKPTGYTITENRGNMHYRPGYRLVKK